MPRVFGVLVVLTGMVWGQSGPDRLGRTTPKSSFLGYLKSAHEGNFSKAARYLQFPAEVPEKDRVELARQLQFVLDRDFVGNFDSISSKPEGSSEEGLAADRESIGAVIGGDQSSPILMVRVSEGGQQVWLLSHEMVQMVPHLFSEFGFPELEKRLPRWTIDMHFWSMPIWVLASIAAAIPLAFGIALGLIWVGTRFLPARWEVSPRPNLPAVLFVTLILHSIAAQLLGLPLLYRVWYARVLRVLWLLVIVWVIFSLIGFVDRRIREYLERNQLTSTQSLLQLGRRLLQLLVLLGAVLIGLRGFGYDITAALAGLGIGGIAIAFAAQKTLENVFGGLTLLSEESIRVGDSCKFDQTIATVEDIGLRATRFRTVQRSVMFIPNGQLATMTIENLGLRDQILFKHVIGVKYGMEPSEMTALLEELRLLLAKDARVAVEGQRAQFLKFGTYSLDIELFAYVLTNDYAEFLRIQEELLLGVMMIVRKHDSEFAFPSQTLYVEKGRLRLDEAGLEPEVSPGPGAGAE
ncbi:MAG: mechanosensitive ion channel [Acidobacteria bacterium]|nr:mechanosensitive ion channel [Acidobacteriota bacterium]